MRKQSVDFYIMPDHELAQTRRNLGGGEPCRQKILTATRRVFISLIFTICFIFTGHTANAVPCTGRTQYSAAGATTCSTVDAGYYTTGCDADGNNCTGQSQCTGTTYCTDGIQHECPDAETHKRTTFPDNYYDAVIQWTYVVDWGSHNAITQCKVETWMISSRGELYEYASYNPDTLKYDNSSTYAWSAVSPGYYLTTKEGCGTYAYYKEIKECPAGSYCPGKTRVECNPSNQSTVHTTNFGLEPCPGGSYCLANSSAPTSCPVDTTTRTMGAVSLDECLALCTGGATKIHAGTHVFNVWRDKHTSPTLKVELPSGGECNINLAPGLKRGTINVDYKDQTYHVTN